MFYQGILIKGDALLNDSKIKDILFLNEKYRKFMLLLNVGGVVLSPIKEFFKILLLSQLGFLIRDILADIFLGNVNPSGKLTTTWAYINDYKFKKEFGNFDDTNYIEGVYIVFRYFNSAGIKPLYLFGFDLSYTKFEISKISFKNEKEK